MDDEFAREVLRLAQGQTVDDYDHELKMQARECGIALPDDNLNHSFGPRSSLTFVSPPRRSTSAASNSTGLTSDLSRSSRENSNSWLRSPTLRSDKRLSTASQLSIKDYDSILSHARFDHRKLSASFSPPLTPSHSCYSLPVASSSRESSPKRLVLRSLSRLRLHRRGGSSSSGENDECSRCPHDSARHRRLVHTLPCGHNYCTAALRRLIKGSIYPDGDCDQAPPPMCCGRPIPGPLIERVMSQKDQERLMSRIILWENDASSTAEEAGATSTDVLARAKGDESTEMAGIARGSKINFTPGLTALQLHEATARLERAMAVPEFRRLREDQEAQRDRFVEWDSRMRRTLSEDCAARIHEVVEQYLSQRDELVQKHAVNIASVEDKHVRDEMDLLAVQETERRNTAIALRHMEAFCRGESTSGEPHKRVVSEQDRMELAKTKYRAEQMERKHEGEINVLRGEQARRMSLRIQKQETEKQQLQAKQTAEVQRCEEQYQSALHEWKDYADKARAKVQEWWALKVDVWRARSTTSEAGTAFDGPFPPLSWPGEEGRGEADSSEAKRGALGTCVDGRGTVAKQSGASRTCVRAASPLGPEKGISAAFTLRSAITSA